MKLELLVRFIKRVNLNRGLEIAQTARQLLRYHSPLILRVDGYLHKNWSFLFPIKGK